MSSSPKRASLLKKDGKDSLDDGDDGSMVRFATMLERLTRSLVTQMTTAVASTEFFNRLRRSVVSHNRLKMEGF